MKTELLAYKSDNIEQTFVLDKWDIKIIKYLKETPIPIISGLTKIWSQRCDINEIDVDIKFILHRLLEICSKLNLVSADRLYNETSPENKWKNLFIYKSNISEFSLEKYHTSSWLGVICTTLILTELKKLPGYPIE